MRKATLKASVAALAPKAAAISCSRPVMRDTSVSRETVEAAFSRFIGGSSLGRRRRRPATQQGRITGSAPNDPCYTFRLCTQRF